MRVRSKCIASFGYLLNSKKCIYQVLTGSGGQEDIMMMNQEPKTCANPYLSIMTIVDKIRFVFGIMTIMISDQSCLNQQHSFRTKKRRTHTGAIKLEIANLKNIRNPSENMANYKDIIIPIKLFTISLPLVLLLLLSFNNVVLSFYCTDSFCADHTSDYQFPCPEPQNCTKIGHRTFLDPDVCNCCEYCFDYLAENDTCKINSPQKPFEMCGPRLTCVMGDKETATCQQMGKRPDDDANFCMKKFQEYETAKENGTLGIAQAEPACDAGGNYAPRQCLPGSICYCSNSEGEKIFGIAAPSDYQDCACARDVARLQQFGFSGRFPHCLPNGDYDELQCVVRTCFCRSHPEEKFAMHKMNASKCFDSSLHIFEPETPRYYMRDCELQRARIDVQIAEAELEGTKVIVADIPKCDPDGNYAAVQSNLERLFCADPSGNQIEAFQAAKFSPSATEMNCHCARARFALANSATGKPKCCNNGNYRPWQCIGSTCFCVDTLGRQDISTEPIQAHEDEKDLLHCYPKEPGPIDGSEMPCPNDI